MKNQFAQFSPSHLLFYAIQLTNARRWNRYIHNAAIVFQFSVDDKESNSSSGNDAKTKAASSNNSSKIVNSNFIESTITTTDKSSNSTNKITPQSSSTSIISEQGGSKSSENETATKANNCDALSDVMNSVIDTSSIKMEIKADPDAPKVTKSVNNIQPALGGSLLPPHAANAKHPVSTWKISFVYYSYALVNISGGILTGRFEKFDREGWEKRAWTGDSLVLCWFASIWVFFLCEREM